MYLQGILHIVPNKNTITIYGVCGVSLLFGVKPLLVSANYVAGNFVCSANLVVSLYVTHKN